MTAAVTEVFGHQVYRGKTKARLETRLHCPAAYWALHIPTVRGDPHAYRKQFWPPLTPMSMDHTKSKNTGQLKYLEAQRMLFSDQRQLLAWPA